MKNSYFKIRRIVSAAILMVLLSPAILPADKNIVIGSPIDVYDRLDDYLDRQLGLLHIPGAAMAVVEEGEIAHFYSFGEARPGGKKPAPETPFVLGSLTKSITAMAVIQLTDAGMIELDAPVVDYLPWFGLGDPGIANALTIRHLLNQTSGLAMLKGMKMLADFDDSVDACSRRVRELAGFTPGRAPGESFEYSDINYNILGLVIEAVSGEKYGDYIENHIYNPLGMNNSYTNYPEAQSGGIAAGHLIRFGRAKPATDLPRPAGSTPSGQLISSAGDMARYMTALLNDGIFEGRTVISSDGISELFAPAVSAGSMGVDMGEYAMGWFIDDAEGERRIWHDGMVPDFFSYMVLLPERNTGLILLVNANHMVVNYSLLDVSEAVTDILTSRPLETGDMGGIFRTLKYFLIIPLVQMLAVGLLLMGIIRRKRSKFYRIWIIPTAVLNSLLIAVFIAVAVMGMTRFMLLFLPDLAGLLIVCSGIAFISFGLQITESIIRRPRQGTASA